MSQAKKNDNFPPEQPALLSPGIVKNAKKSKTEKKIQPPNKWSDSFFLLIFGVMVPVLAIVIETTTHMCATSFFDPLPSPAHILLFALIPLCNLLTVIGLWKDISAFYAINSLMNGMAMGIAVLYAIMFLPILPWVAISTTIGIPMAGMSCLQFIIQLLHHTNTYASLAGFQILAAGLSGLAPYLSLITLPRAGHIVVQEAEKIGVFVKPKQLHHLGHLIVLIAVVAVELPSTLTRYWLMEASKPSSEIQALTTLRQFGNREVLLRACYEHSGRATDILGSLAEMITPVKTQTAQEIFYRVTGQPYNSVPIPAGARAARSTGAAERGISGFNKHSANHSFPEQASAVVVHSDDEFDYDTGIAGETVSGVARGLSLANSSIRGTVDAEAATAKLTWSMHFENISDYEREARCHFLLPPNAVVTDARLYLKDEQREATIQPRGEARAIYQAAAQERKNPLLISTYGKNRIMMQCFPVRKGEKFDAELDIAVPLRLKSFAKAELSLPKFEERNFPVPNTHHLTLLYSPSAATKINHPISMKNIKLGTPDAIFEIERDPSIKEIAATNNTSTSSTYVQEILAAIPPTSPQRIYILIDGSETMTKNFPAIAAALKSLPQSIPCQIILQKDKAIRLTDVPITPDSGEFHKALAGLASMQGAGGQLDLPVLNKIAREARTKKGSAILWLHGAQPVMGRGIDTNDLRRALRRSSGPILFDFQLNPGPNRILENLPNRAKFFNCSISGDLQDDFARLIAHWTQPNYHIAYQATGLAPNAKITKNAELTKLWANQNIAHLLAHKKRTEAIQEALLYHLVTPVSSAVIVDAPIRTPHSRNTESPDEVIVMAESHETGAAAQKSNPLVKPGLAGLMIPIAPESDTWILLGIAGLVGLACALKQKPAFNKQ